MINIKRKDTSVHTCFSTSINQGSKRKYTLMKEDYITLKFSVDNNVDKPVYFKLGDYVDESFGLFEIVDLQKPTFNEATGGYDYDLRLNAYYWKWKNKEFMFVYEKNVDGKLQYIRKEMSWNLTASLDVHLGILVKNLVALGYKYREDAFDFTIHETVKNSAKLIQYDNTNLIDALSKLAGAWECEWWITDNQIHFGRCEYGDPVNFEIGENVASMSRSDGQTSYASRIYAFGSTRNLPANYRQVDENVVVNGVVQKRLMLPGGTPYMDTSENMTQEEAIEDVVIFEDVYPHRVGVVSGIHTHVYTDKIEEEGKEPVFKKWNAYRFKDTGITFSKEYVLPGQELKITFQSGLLNGMEFAVIFNPYDKDSEDIAQPEKNKDGSWNPAAQVWEIVRNENYGRPLPDDELRPRIEHKEGEVLVPADTYILSGFDAKFVSDKMIPAAEEELKTKVLQYIEKSKIDPSVYDCRMVSSYIYNDGVLKTFEIGDKVNLINKMYFENGRQSRIIGYEYNLDLLYDSPVYTIGETVSYSRLGNLEGKIDALTYKGQAYMGTGGSGVYLIVSNDNTVATDRNAYSAKRALKQFLSKTGPDSTEYFLKLLGGTSVENGITTDSILVKSSLTTQQLKSAISSALTEEGDGSLDTLSLSLIEEGDGNEAVMSTALLEEPAESREGATTLGDLTNVSKTADGTSLTDDILVRKWGTKEWTIDSSLFGNVLSLMTKVFPFTISLSGGGTYELGSTVTVTLVWSYDREIASQLLNGSPLALDARTKEIGGVMEDTTYILSAVCAERIYTKSVSAAFRLKKYYGVSSDEALNNDQILALTNTWAQRTQAETRFDCTGGKYPFYILPASMASDIQFWIGGLRNTDWKQDRISVTNAYGHQEMYDVFRMNTIQTGILNIEMR